MNTLSNWAFKESFHKATVVLKRNFTFTDSWPFPKYLFLMTHKSVWLFF